MADMFGSVGAEGAPDALPYNYHVYVLEGNL